MDGASRIDDDVASPRQVKAMALLVLGDHSVRWEEGSELPPLWHWIFFPEALSDKVPGMPEDLPPLRVWASGNVELCQPIIVGSNMERTTSVLGIKTVENEFGRTVTVDVAYQIRSDCRVCVKEVRRYVHIERARPSQSSFQDETDAPSAHSGVWIPNQDELLSYSALTLSGNRIHIDREFSTKIMGYKDLVIHSPLIATKIAAAAIQIYGKKIKRLQYRCLKAATLGQPIHLQVNDGEGASCKVIATGESGDVMEVTTYFCGE